MLGCDPLSTNPISFCMLEPLSTFPMIVLAPGPTVFTPANITITVTDPDRAGEFVLPIDINVDNGADVETQVILNETTPGVFVGTISAAEVAQVSEDNVLQHINPNTPFVVTVIEQGGGPVTYSGILTPPPPPPPSEAIDGKRTLYSIRGTFLGRR